MNMRQVEIFRAVMGNGTTSRAAEVLRISQPAVSKGLQDLERSLGFALFDRSRGRMVPTEEGRLFIREVDESFRGLDRLRSAAARIRDFGSGELRIACLSALSTNVVPAALKSFLVRHPDVAVTFQARMSSSVRDLVASGQFDLGLAADEVDLTGVEARPFRKFRVAVAIPAGHRLEALDVVGPGDLDGERFIALAPEDTTRQEAERLFAEVGASPKTVLETPYSTTVCAMVGAGLGVGLVNPITAEMFLGRGLTLRPFEPAIHFRTLILLPPDRRPSRILDDFIEALMRTVDEG